MWQSPNQSTVYYRLLLFVKSCFGSTLGVPGHEADPDDDE
jgi:hypothetical protein